MDLKNKNGFSILSVILVIAVVIVVIGVWALSGGLNKSSENSNLDVQISSIMNDADNIKSAYDNLVINGTDANNIVFMPNTASTNTAVNILDPSQGISIPNNYPSLVDPTLPTFWVYNYNGGISGVSGLRRIIYLFGIKDNVCKRINYLLFGQSTIYASGMSTKFFYQGISASSPTVTGTPGFTPGPKGEWYGCFGISTLPDRNVYYRVVG